MFHTFSSPLLRWAALAALLFVFACDSGSSNKGLSIDDGAALGENVDGLVQPDEELTLTLKTGATLKFPAGAVTEALEVSFSRPADKQARGLAKTLGSHQKLASAPYVVKPHGASFEQDVEVSLPIAKDRDASKLKVVWLEDEDEKEWKSLGKPQISGGKASFRVNHFSVYALVEEGPISGGGGGNATARLLSRLTECGLVERQGEYLPIELVTAEDQCMFECMLELPCSEYETLFCGAFEDFVGDGATACFEQCEPADSASCDDGEPIPASFICDGEQDCADGSDERDCPNSFQCGDGQSFPAAFECDGVPDCRDASDEDSTLCADRTFICDGGNTVVGQTEVCDLFADCEDGSDEHAGCAKLTCEARPTSMRSGPLDPPSNGDAANTLRSLKTKARKKR